MINLESDNVIYTFNKRLMLIINYILTVKKFVLLIDRIKFETNSVIGAFEEKAIYISLL